MILLLISIRCLGGFLLLEEKIVYEEREKKAGSGALALILIVLLLLASIGAAILGSVRLSDEQNSSPWGAVLLTAGILAFVLGCILLPGLKVINPKEALVLTLFGKYCGTLKKDGSYLGKSLLHRGKSYRRNRADYWAELRNHF